MSFHQLEDFAETAIRLIAQSNHSAPQQRQLIHQLYQFHDQHDTSYTRFRVKDILERLHYLYEWPIEQHPDYANQADFFANLNMLKSPWIPADFKPNQVQNGHVFIQESPTGWKLYFEYGDLFWNRVCNQLAKADQQLPKESSKAALFLELLLIAEQSQQADFFRDTYAALVEFFIEEAWSNQEGFPEDFLNWSKDALLVKIRALGKAAQTLLQQESEYPIFELLNLEEELELNPSEAEQAKLRFFLDFSVSTKRIEKDYLKAIAPPTEQQEKLQFIYDYFRAVLDESWQDGLKQIEENKAVFSFMKLLRAADDDKEALYTTLILEYDPEFKLLSCRVNIQNGLLLSLQGRSAGIALHQQHFSEALLTIAPEEFWEKNSHLNSWGGWKYSLKHQKKTLKKRLDNLWECYCTYSEQFYQFYKKSLKDWVNLDPIKAAERRQALLEEEVSFFGNKMDFYLTLAALNQYFGHLNLVNAYLELVEKEFEQGLGSEALRARIQQGVAYVEKKQSNFPEITTIYTIRKQ